MSTTAVSAVNNFATKPTVDVVIGLWRGIYSLLCNVTDLAIYWTLGNFFKPLETINLPKSPTFLGNFCKGVKNLSISSEINFGQLLLTFGDFFWSHCFCGTVDEGVVHI